MENFHYSLQLRQDHIDCGKQKHALECAVALFLTEAKEIPIRVTERGAWEDLHTYPHFGRKIAAFGSQLQKFIRRFDKDKTLCSPQKISVRIGPRGGVVMDLVDEIY